MTFLQRTRITRECIAYLRPTTTLPTIGRRGQQIPAVALRLRTFFERYQLQWPEHDLTKLSHNAPRPRVRILFPSRSYWRLRYRAARWSHDPPVRHSALWSWLVRSEVQTHCTDDKRCLAAAPDRSSAKSRCQRHVRSGSWSCENARVIPMSILKGSRGSAGGAPHALIAASRGLTPMIFMTRVRL
jgi:hypothetical protein